MKGKLEAKIKELNAMKLKYRSREQIFADMKSEVDALAKANKMIF